MSRCLLFNFIPKNREKLENEKKENFDQTDSKKKHILILDLSILSKSLNSRTFVIKKHLALFPRPKISQKM